MKGYIILKSITVIFFNSFSIFLIFVRLIIKDYDLKHHNFLYKINSNFSNTNKVYINFFMNNNYP